MNPHRKGDTFGLDQVAYAFTPEALKRCVNSIHEAEVVVFDLETTGLDEHAPNARVAMMTLTLPTAADRKAGREPVTWVIPLSHRESPFMGTWRAALRQLAEAMRGRPLVAHNGKFDLRWVYSATGVDLSPDLVWDSQVVAHLLDENTPSRLKDRAVADFDILDWGDDIEFTEFAAAERMPFYELSEYAARDTYWTWRLYAKQRSTIVIDLTEIGDDEPLEAEDYEAAKLGKFAELVVMPMVRTLAGVEQRGIGVDLDWVQDEKRRLADERDTSRAELLDTVQISNDGEPSFAPTSKWFQEWAGTAVSFGLLTVDATTPTGKPQWSRHVLTRQARKGSRLAECLLEYRQAVKKLEFLESWSAKASGDRLYPRYNVGRVVTGRLSSADPNLQQVTKALKPAFIPSPGHYLAEIDFSQIELRTAAFIARCVPMIEAYQRGDDLHSLMAATITGKPVAEVTKKERQQGKAANFGLLYLQSPEGFRTYAETAYGVELTAEEAAHTHGAFFEQWAGMREWHNSVLKQVNRDGYVTSPLGRIRRLPGIWGDPFMRSESERQAVNSPVQSFASDVMQIAAADVMGEYGPGVPDVRVVGTVHDSIVVEVPADDWQRATARVMRRMLSPHHVLERLGCGLDVPLGAEASVGSRWGMSDIGTIVG